MEYSKDVKRLRDDIRVFDQVIAELTKQYETWKSDSPISIERREAIRVEIERMKDLNEEWHRVLNEAMANP